MQTLQTVFGKHAQLDGVRSQPEILPGVKLALIDVKRMPDVYRDMARHQPYAVCEMAPTMYLMALERGAALTALPLPMTRRFRHSGIKQRKGLALSSPKALEGRKVGVRNYSVTAAVWTRGVFADDYGLDASKVTWVTEEAENLDDLPLPPNVERLPPGQTIAEAPARGELDLAFDGLAGAGNADDMEDLVTDAAAVEQRWFDRTSIYPIHGVIVVRNDVIRDHPGIQQALYQRFDEAKQAYLARLDSIAVPSGDDKRYRRLRALMADPLPYGFAENQASFEALIRYAHEQKLIGKLVRADQVFVDPRTGGPTQVAHWK